MRPSSGPFERSAHAVAIPSPETLMDRKHLPPDSPPTGPFGLKHDEWGRLLLIDASGRRHSGVEPVRAFPISEPGRWVSLCDAEGRELTCVEDLAELSDATRRVLEADLAAREFVPVILRIVRVSAETTPTEWAVETDRGPTRFTLKTEEDVRRLGPDRYLIVDAQGLRYLISDANALDLASRRVMEHYS